MNNEIQIQIQKECLEFVNLQVCGKCHDEERKRLTLANLNSEAKALLRHIQALLYFGDPITYTAEQFDAVKKLFKNLKNKVTPPEMNLINYLSLLINGSKDIATFQNLQRYYNQAIEKQQQKHLKTI
jgi:hypothetical protein